MLGRHHVVVGASVGAAVATLDHGPVLFARGLEAVHPLAVLDTSHAFLPASHVLAALPLPAWFAVPVGVVLADVVGISVAALFSLLPDIDSHASTLGKVFPNWARYLTGMKHRGETHWLITGLLVAGLVGLCMTGAPMGPFFVHLTLGGYLIGHLFCDLITKEGLVLFGPFIRAVIRGPRLAFKATGRGGPVVG